jgi:hypothetical protein
LQANPPPDAVQTALYIHLSLGGLTGSGNRISPNYEDLMLTAKYS